MNIDDIVREYYRNGQASLNHPLGRGFFVIIVNEVVPGSMEINSDLI